MVKVIGQALLSSVMELGSLVGCSCMFPRATWTCLTGEEILAVFCEAAHKENLQRSVAPSSTASLGFLMGGRELPFQCCPRLQGGALTRVREAVAGISMHSSTWMQHKHPKRFQWILFCLIKNTNQACMYYLIYINIYSIYKTNASGQRLSLWHKL